MLFSSVLLDGARADVRVSGDRVVGVAPAGALSPSPGEERVEGGLLCPPFAEPHVHLDATLLGARTPNRSGTLREGIANWAAVRGALTVEDVTVRATATLREYARFGTLRVRTHVDTGCPVAVEALLALRDRLRDGGLALGPGGPSVPMELQVVAFPQEGILRAPGRRAAWEAAVEAGCDAVGAIPHFERTAEEGWASVRLAFDLAERAGRRLDLHCDETDDPGSRNLEVVCAQAIDRGWVTPGAIVTGHCTALHSYPNPHAAKVCELVATAGVMVVANPLDNVVLQGRYDGYPRRRGLTRVDELWRAGATVGVGHDSVVDPWYRLGTANLLDAAYMLVHLGHLTAEAELARAFRTLHSTNHLPFGAPPAVAPDAPATLLWFAPGPLGDDEIEALRTRAAPRLLVGGRWV